MKTSVPSFSPVDAARSGRGARASSALYSDAGTQKRLRASIGRTGERRANEPDSTRLESNLGMQLPLRGALGDEWAPGAA